MEPFFKVTAIVPFLLLLLLQLELLLYSRRSGGGDYYGVAASVTVNRYDAIKRNGTLAISMPAGPIVVHSEPKQYEYPTLDEYRECHTKLDECRRQCNEQNLEQYGNNRTLCELQECPICPILLDKKILVQGVNDSQHNEEIVTNPLNTTNIIHLTNEIHNVIDHHLGNITQNTANNVHLHQNISSDLLSGVTSMEKNGSLPCCQLVYIQRSPGCQQQQQQHHRHHHEQYCRYYLKRKHLCHRIHCRAPLMFKKRMIICEDNEYYADLYVGGDSYIYDKCHTITRYVPYQRKHLPANHNNGLQQQQRQHRNAYDSVRSLSNGNPMDHFDKHHQQQQQQRKHNHVRNRRRNWRCRYQNHWPYVICPTMDIDGRSVMMIKKGQQHHHNHHRNRKGYTNSMQHCEHCYRLSYLHILRHGISRHCQHCFSMKSTYLTQYPTFPMNFYPPMIYTGLNNVGDNELIDWTYNSRHNTWIQGANEDDDYDLMGSEEHDIEGRNNHDKDYDIDNIEHETLDNDDDDDKDVDVDVDEEEAEEEQQHTQKNHNHHHKDTDKNTDKVCELLPNGNLIGDCDEYKDHPNHHQPSVESSSVEKIDKDNINLTVSSPPPPNTTEGPDGKSRSSENQDHNESEINTRQRRFTRSRYSRRHRSIN